MKRAFRTTALIPIITLLAACTGEPAQDDACKPRGENLLQDLSFATIDAPRPQREWHSSEHAAGQTFEYSADNGTLQIHKTGGEPWFLLSQSVDTTAIAGKRLTFGAEVKLDLQLPEDHNFKPGGGLAVLARKNGAVVINSTLEHEPRLGTTDWTPVDVTVKVPKGTGFLRVGFLHQAEGTLLVRQPFLKLAPGKDCAQ